MKSHNTSKTFGVPYFWTHIEEVPTVGDLIAWVGCSENPIAKWYQRHGESQNEFFGRVRADIRARRTQSFKKERTRKDREFAEWVRSS